MPGELLEYVIRVVGGQAAAARVAEVSGSFDKLAASEERAGLAGKSAGEKSAAGATMMKGAFKSAGIGAAAALVGLGLESVKMANKFDTEMLKIRTEGGATTKEFHRMKVAVNDMAKSGASMGQGPVALAQGLGHLESMGLRGARALKALKLASEEAAIRGAHLEDTTTAVGGALFVAMKGTGGLSGVMNVLNGIAGAGNMRFQQLNEALGTGLLPAAKLAGLNIQETGAALGVLTDSGQQASSAAATLATALHFLYAPTAKAQAALKTINLSGHTLSDDLRKPQGLSAALGDLRKHLAGLSTFQQQNVLSAILPGGRGRVLLQLLTMLDRLPPKFRQISAASKSSDFGKHVMEQAGNAATKTHMRVAAFRASMVDLGHAIGPTVNKLKNFGLEAGTWLVQQLILVVNGFKIASKWVGKLFSAVNHVDFWGGLKKGMAEVILFIVNRMNDLIGAYNSTLGSLPFAPKIGTIDTSSLQAAVTGPQPTLTKTVGNVVQGVGNTIKSVAGAGPAGSGSKVQTHAAHTALAGGDIHIHIAGQHFAKVTRREIQKAMMAGA